MSLRVQVVSAEKEVWSGEASTVVARTTEGEIGVLGGHEPLLAVLVPGDVRVDGVGGEAGLSATIDGGFLSVENDTVLVVAERVQVGEPGSSRGTAAGTAH